MVRHDLLYLQITTHLLESLVYKQIGTSSKFNLKLQICQVTYRVILLQLVWDLSVLDEHLHAFIMNRKEVKVGGSVCIIRQDETEMVGYCPTCKNIHLSKRTQYIHGGNISETIAVLVDCVLSIFKSSCAFSGKLLN